MTVWYKQGVQGDLQPIARKGFGRVARLHEDVGHDTFVKSLRDRDHLAGSFHYDGLAFDIGKDNLVLVNDIREALGPDWDVIEGSTYIHCEYDPEII